MPSADLRRLLLRVQTDADFYNLMLVDPQRALAGYSITPQEQEVLLRRDRSIYQFLIPPRPKPTVFAEKEPEEPDEPSPPSLNLTLPPLPPPDPLLGPPSPHPPEPPLPEPPEPPDVFPNPLPPNPPQIFPDPPEIFQSPPIPINFLSGLNVGTDVAEVPASLITTIQQSSGEERVQGIVQLLKTLDRR